MTSSLSAALSLYTTLFAPAPREASELTQLFGPEPSHLLLQRLIDHCNGKEEVPADLWTQLSQLDNFTSIACRALQASSLRRSTESLQQVSASLSLPIEQQLVLGAAALEADDEAWRSAGAHFLNTKLTQAAADPDCKLPAGLLQRLLAPAKQVPALQNAAVAAGLIKHPATDANRSDSGGTSAAILAALLSGSAAAAVDALPSGASQGGAAVTGDSGGISGRNSSSFALAMAPNDVAGANRLASVMQELGYSCTASEGAFRAILAQFQKLDEAAVAEVLGLMARTQRGLDDSPGLHGTLSAVLDMGSTNGSGAGSGEATWNVNVVVDALKAQNPGLSWQGVAAALDHEGFRVQDQAALALLVGAFKRATGEGLPVNALVQRLWANTAGQLSLLTAATAAPPELFSFEQSFRRLAPVEGLAGGKAPLGTPNGAWASLDLLDVLCQLAEAGHFPAVRALLEAPMSTCPEVLLLGMAAARAGSVQGPRGWGVLERLVFGSLVPAYLAPGPNSSLVLRRLWGSNQAVVLQGMVEWYSADPSHAPRILEVAQQLQAINALLDAAPLPLAIELAALAMSGDGGMSLLVWPKDALGRHGAPFVSELLAFVATKVVSVVEGVPTQGRVRVSPEALAALLAVLGGRGRAVLPERSADIERAQDAALKVYPAAAPLLAAIAAAGGSSAAAGACAMAVPGAAPFAQDVEQEANNYFNRIYGENKPVAEVVEVLRGFKASPVQREQEVFACMVHNLFDEYRFYEHYPDKELSITAQLFGSLLHHQLLSSISLGMALKCVLDALAAPPDGKMFRFGLDALAQFRGDLHLWPQFCAAVLAIPHMQATDPGLCAFMEGIVRADTGAGGAGAPQQQPGQQQDLAAPPAASSSTNASNGAGPVVSSAPAVATSSGPAALWGSGIVTGSGGFGGDANAAPVSAPFGTGAFGGLSNGGGLGPMPVDEPQVGMDVAGAAAAAASAAAANGTDAAGTAAATGAAASDRGDGKEPAGPAAAAAGEAGAGAGKPPTGTRSPLPSVAAAAAADGPSAGSGGTGEALGALVGNQSVAQAAATMALSEKPMMLALMTINAETLETAERQLKEVAAPPDDKVDKVSFLMNNLSPNNLDVKGADLAALVLPEFCAWFSNYLVVKRAAQEPNHHKLYVSLLDACNDKELNKAVLRTTYYYAKALLDSDRAITQTNERTLIKQLGTWLGLLTFSKNRPVLARDMDFKAMICDAYQRGRMIAVLPFVEKVLAACKGSKVFKATNPMIAGILALLAEIHAMERLKLNISFVIEMTFKTFEVRLDEVKPATALADLPRQSMHNPDFSALAEPPKLPSSSAPPPLGAPPPLTPPSSMPGAGPQAGAPGTPPPPGTTTPARTPEGQQHKPGAAATPTAADMAAASPGAAAAAAGTPGAPPLVSADQGLFGKLHAYVQISPSLGVIAERLALKRVVPMAVDRAICEIITPVVERSVTIACMTTYELVTKDYALDPDEARLRKAAHLMVSSLAGSLALVTCKEPLRVSLTNQLRGMLQGQANIDTAALEHAVQVLVGDNLELGCTIIERAATDKAVRDIDKSLQAGYEARAKARSMGTNYYEAAAYHQAGRFPASLPESLKPKPGLPQQQRVYDDFARLPRLIPPHPLARQGEGGQGGQADGSGGDKTPTNVPSEALAGAALLEAYMKWQASADLTVSRDPNATPESSPEQAALLAELRDTVNSQGPALEDSALFIAKRIAKHLWEGAGAAMGAAGAAGAGAAGGALSKAHVALHVDALRLLYDMGAKRVPAELTALFCGAGTLGDARLNVAVGEALLRRGLLAMPDVDAHLSKLLAVTRSSAAIDWVVMALKACRAGGLGYAELYASFEVLGKVAASLQGGEMVTQLLAQARAASKVRSAERAGVPDIAGLRDKAPDPPGLQQQVSALFEDWARRLMATPEDSIQRDFVANLRNAGLLKMDDVTDRMLRILFELGVTHCLANESPPLAPGRPAEASLSFLAIDPLVKLLACLTTAHGGGEAFLGRSLTVLTALVRRDADDRLGMFSGRPYLRLLVGLAAELSPGSADAAAAATAAATAVAVSPGAGNAAERDPAGLRFLRLIGSALLTVQPASVPGFAFAYLEVMSHRAFMPKLLLAPGQAGWPLFEALLVGLLSFLEPHLRAAELPDSIRALYKGTLRLLLVLLHDFPEFLCEHHFTLCDAIPPPAIQMRNLILSAFPRNMRLPDPFTQGLRVDQLPEIAAPPRGLPHPDKLLPQQLRASLDAYLAAPRGSGAGAAAAAAFPSALVRRLQLSTEGARAAGTNVNVPLLNALVLYVGSSHPPGSPLPPGSAVLELFGRLVGELDAEGRYLLLNAIANQLRYPNSHTHTFSCVLLALFAGAGSEAVQEQITRVLLERLIVNRPHPWGLLITFIELIKNPRFNFWSHAFTRCAPEIERLFESVARSCMGPSSNAAKGDGEGEGAAAAAGAVGAVLKQEGVRA